MFDAYISKQLFAEADAVGERTNRVFTSPSAHHRCYHARLMQGSYHVPHQANTNRGALGPQIAYVANEGAVAERVKLLVGRIIIWEAEKWVPEKG